MQERRGEEDALAHALRVRGHRAAPAVVEQKQAQQLGDRRVEPCVGDAAQAPDGHQGADDFTAVHGEADLSTARKPL